MAQNNIWSEFDEAINTEELQKEVEAAAENKFEDVPAGTYRVGVEKMELGKSKKSDPMCSIWFVINEGKYKKQKIFYNQVVKNGFGIHNNNEFLRSMQLDCVDSAEEYGKAMFRNYNQYGELLLDAAEEIDEYGLTFDLEYTEGKNGFHNYKIVNVYEG